MGEELADEIEKIRELGISYSLSDRAIDDCLLQAISRHVSAESIESHVKKARKSKSESNTSNPCLRVVYLALVVFTVAYLVGSFHAPTARLLTRATSNASYPFFRYVRFLTLPIARNFDLTMLHQSECLVPNPLFAEPPVDCEPCMDIKQVGLMSVEEATKNREQYLGQAKPIVIRGGYDHEVTFEDLTITYMKYEHIFNQNSQPIFSTVESITDASILFHNYSASIIVKTPNFHAEWYPSRVSHAKVVRTMFKRPSFVPPESEIALEKGIFVDHPKSKPYSVIQGHYPHTYFIQGAGKRRMMLVPHEHCQEVCNTQSIVLKPKDILYFHDAFWVLDTLPVFGKEASKDVSIGYMASFA